MVTETATWCSATRGSTPGCEPRPGDRPADYEYRQGWQDSRFVEVPFDKPESTLMFEDFAAMVGDDHWKARSIRASERTQQWLDAVWQSALENEIASG